MDPAGEFSVCICVRDGAAHVDRCLRAVFAEVASRDVDVVVVDHNSIDGTPALLAAWGARFPDRLRIVRFEGDGLAAARNVAWQTARSRWVAFVDVDCEVQHDWAAQVAAAIIRHGADESVAAIGGVNHVLVDGSLLSRACAVFLPEYVGGHGSVQNRPTQTATRVDHCPTLNVVYRRSALAAVGGFDERYARVAEDVALSRRLRRRGYELWVEPGFAVAHAPRATLAAWLSNMFLYGRGRTFDFKQAPEDLEAKFWAPAMMVLLYVAGVISLVVGSAVGLATLAVVHVASVGGVLVMPARRRGAGAQVWLAATVVVCLTHVSYGAGQIYELARRRDRFVV